MHEYYMKRALELARLGWGRTNPNPLVGAVIVKDGIVVAEGFHKALGFAHAEVDAFNNASRSVKGGTLYVNLEPCSHYGRTPPCAKAVIDMGISEVFIGMEDPNPLVAGRGCEMLRNAGIKVTTGVMRNEAEKLNEIFIKYITVKRPFVIMKTAMTLDGKIAAYSGETGWISGECSRKHVHMIRDRVSAIMVGINTVLKDNPCLTTRLEGAYGKDPVRIVVDSKGVIPLDCKVIDPASSTGVILATTSAIEPDKEKQLLDAGVKILKLDDDANSRVDLGKLMDELYKLEIDSVLLEGGGNLNFSALSAGIVDKVMSFIAPKIVGGKNAVTPVEGEGIYLMQDAICLRDISIDRFGDDVLLEGYVCRS